MSQDDIKAMLAVLFFFGAAVIAIRWMADTLARRRQRRRMAEPRHDR